MFSEEKNSPEEIIPAKKSDPYENLKQFYFHDIDGQKLVLNIANDFKVSNVIMRFDDGTIWQVSYVGKVLDFLNATILQISTGTALPPVMKKWVEGALPVNINPQVEIGPDKVVNYAMQTVLNYPTKEYEKYVQELGHFKILYDNSEIVKNLRKKSQND